MLVFNRRDALFICIISPGLFFGEGCENSPASVPQTDTDIDADSDSDWSADSDTDWDTDEGADSEFVCEGAERTVVIGDIHGDPSALKEALRIGGVIDENDNWIGGPTAVVQVGDILDRGPGERETIELLLDLQDFTDNIDCGEINVLVGNHEIITVESDYQYMDEETCMEYADLEGLDLEQPELNGLSEECKKRGAAFLPGGPYARVLAEWPVSLILEDVIYVHGGLVPAHIDYGLGRTNKEVANWMLGYDEDPPGTVAYNAASMVWNRTYSEGEPSEQECDILSGILKELKLSHMIVGHTVQDAINPACDGMVWRVDVGMTDFYGGEIQVLQIQDDKFTVLKNLH